MVTQLPPMPPTRPVAGEVLAPSAVADAADSVYEYVARTAERAEDGVRWETLTYEGQRHSSNRLHNGVAGIALFLSQYAAVRGVAQACELAELALRWSTAPAQMAGAAAHPFRGPGMRNSLMVGRAGVGLAWLEHYRITRERQHLEAARAIGDALLADEPGPFLYFLSGVAGEGVFLLRLWEATRDERYLAGAVQDATFVERQAQRDARGVLWPARDPAAVAPEGQRFAGGNPAPFRWLGFGIGLAGVTHFLARVTIATDDERWRRLTREAADTLARFASPDHGGVNWQAEPVDTADDGKRLCQWCRGATGIGLCLITCAAALGEPAYLRLAEAAGECTYAYGDVRANPSLCHGLSGNAQLFLALHGATGEAGWWQRAEQFAAQALAYQSHTSAGPVWQADEPASTSPELMCGASGVGLFFLQLLAPERVRFSIL